jgi:hypothetical protein
MRKTIWVDPGFDSATNPAEACFRLHRIGKMTRSAFPLENCSNGIAAEVNAALSCLSAPQTSGRYRWAVDSTYSIYSGIDHLGTVGKVAPGYSPKRVGAQSEWAIGGPGFGSALRRVRAM